ncbi:MAG: hypothetical protein J6Y60_02335 [Treponema sp.]|nr:hypothetical protein [Treponema sp.]
MSTASIRKPMIITSEKSAKVIADVLEMTPKTTNNKIYPQSVKEIKGKTILGLLKRAK